MLKLALWIILGFCLPAAACAQAPLSKVTNTARETYRISRGAFTTDGIPSDDELTEYLKEDAKILGLPAPVPVAKVFDFSLQREINRELGVK